MRGDKRTVKKIVTVLVLFVVLGITLSGLRIRSVGQYKQEQKQLAQDLFATPDATQSDRQPSAGTATPDATQSNRQPPSDTTPPDSVTASEKPAQKTPSDKRDAKVKSSNPPANTPSQARSAKRSHKEKTEKAKTTKSQKKKTPTKQAPKGKSSADDKTTKQPVATAKPDEALTCTITIRCDSLRKHWSLLSDKVKAKMPENGVFLKTTTVNITGSDTAYSILQKVCKAKNIALDAEYSTAFSTEYVRGIGYLYEKEAGDMSGWLYRVNGKLPNYGASNYSIKPKDHIEWLYTCTGKVE